MDLDVIFQTFAELKEEESSLLKERTYLEKEIATLQATFKQQRAKNENFKRIKVNSAVFSSRILSRGSALLSFRLDTIICICIMIR